MQLIQLWVTSWQTGRRNIFSNAPRKSSYYETFERKTEAYRNNFTLWRCRPQQPLWALLLVFSAVENRKTAKLWPEIHPELAVTCVRDHIFPKKGESSNVAVIFSHKFFSGEIPREGYVFHLQALMFPTSGIHCVRTDISQPKYGYWTENANSPETLSSIIKTGWLIPPSEPHCLKTPVCRIS